MADDNARDPLGVSGAILDGKYEIESAIGEGGSAVVYRAMNKTWGMPVAIKFYVSLSSAPENQRDKLLGEFVQEGQILLQLSSRSPAIVQPRDMGAYTSPRKAWLPYLVLEWLEGAPLDVVLVEETNRGFSPRTLAQAMKLLAPAALALAMAHEQSIVHRDIKPENMFVVGGPRSPDARIKLLDFGIAKVMATQHGNLLQTAAAATPFTPHYGAPEQFSRSYGSTGPWTDVFSLALVVLEVMRGGERAFRGDDYLELGMQSRDEHHRPTPRALHLEVNDDVEAVFARAVAIGPQDRYASAGEFWSALEGAVASEPQKPRVAKSAPPQIPLRSSAPPPRSDPEATALGSGPPVKARGSRSVVFVAGAIGAVLIASAAVVAGQRAGHTPTPAPDGSAAASARASTTAMGSATTLSPKVTPSVVASTGVCPPSAVAILGGKFEMGSGSIDKAGPEHGVFVDAFCLDRNEITSKEVAGCVERGKCKAPPVDIHDDQPAEAPGAHSDGRAKECTFGAIDRATHPMNCVTFDEAETYCASVGMRLPTEAEWEYAAAGSERRKFPWGNESVEGRANACGSECVARQKDLGLPLSQPAYTSDDKFAATAPVGNFPGGTTKSGVTDLAGNVAEWTSSYFGPYPDDDEVNPKGPATGERRVVRGGGFECGEDRLLTQSRGFAKPDTRSPEIGFRCASALLH